MMNTPAHDPGPVPDEQPTTPNRAHIIAAIHALADWVRDNPDVPAPTHVTLKHLTTTTDELDERLRVAPVLRIADNRPDFRPAAETVYDVYAMAFLMRRPEQPIQAVYFVSAELDCSLLAGRYVR